MAMTTVVYSGWICPTAAGSTVQTRAGSVMVEKDTSLCSNIITYTTTQQDKEMTAQ